MFSLKRNQVIITALVIMICVAGYLNYLDSREDEIALGDEGGLYTMTNGGDIAAIILDSATGQEIGLINGGYVDGEIAIETDNNPGGAGPDTGETSESSESSESEPGAAVFVSASSDSSFFVQAKLSREQDRSKQKESLTDLIGSSELDKDTKSLCAEAILAISERTEKEGAAEAALAAKGFGESYVRIDDNYVEVIINKNTITDQELAQLEDIVTRYTGAAIDKIRLSSVKAN